MTAAKHGALLSDAVVYQRRLLVQRLCWVRVTVPLTLVRLHCQHKSVGDMPPCLKHTAAALCPQLQWAPNLLQTVNLKNGWY